MTAITILNDGVKYIPIGAVEAQGRRYLARIDAIAALPNMPLWTTFTAGRLSYVKNGGSAIADMPGCAPLDEITPNHFQDNVTENVTDMSVGSMAAIAYASTFKAGAGFGSGNTVLFLDQQYRLTQSLPVRQSGVSIKGVNRNRSKINFDNPTGVLFDFAAANTLSGTQLARNYIENLTLECTAADPTGAVLIRMTRGAQAGIKQITFINPYRCIELLGTGETVVIDDTTSAHGSNSTSYKAGSATLFLGRAEVSSGGYLDTVDGKYYTEPNSVYVSNSNWRSGNNGVMDNVIIGCVDGLYMSNNHIGFAKNACMKISAQQDVISVNNINVSNTFFDPNPTFGTAYGVLIDGTLGSAIATVGTLNFTGCDIGGGDIAGVAIKAKCGRFVYNGGTVKGTGGPAFDVDHADAEDVVVNGVSIYATNRSAPGGNKPAVLLQRGKKATVVNCPISSGYRGVHIAAAFNRAHVAGNTFDSLTNGVSIYLEDAHQDNHTFSVNNIVESMTVASTSVLSLPLGGTDVFYVTGTNSFSAIRTQAPSSTVTGRIVTLIFEGILNANNGTNVRTAGGVNFPTSADMVVQFVYKNGKWREMSRAA
jgi:hypothetical protein